MSKHSPVPTLFAAALACACAPTLAHAENAASASARVATYTLTDLAPDDGIAPSVTFTRGWHNGGVTLYKYDYTNASHVTADVPLDATGHAAASQPGAEAHASLVGQEASSSVRLDTPQSGGADAEFTDDFVLSPNTRMTLTFSGSATGTKGDDGTAHAWADVSVMLLSPAVGWATYREGRWDSYDRSGNQPDSVSFDLETGANASDGYLTVTSFSDAALPVPEPRSWSMLAAGLLMGALPAWRRRSRKG